MIKKLLDAVNSLSSTEKSEIILIIFTLFIATSSILLAISWSRGSDVEYFKNKLHSLEERFIVAEKARNDAKDKITELQVQNVEQKHQIENLQVRSAETENWMEEFNKLPQLPKPKNRPQRLTPLPQSR